MQELIRDLNCLACGKKFTSRKNTVLYRLKTHSGLVEKILWLLSLGVDASALEEVFGVQEITIRTWLCRSGKQGRKLHDRFMLGLDLIHVQLDELWANVKRSTQDMWVWVACDATTKIIPVIQVGGRTQEMAYLVVHELIRKAALGVRAGLQHGWAQALLLRLNLTFRQVGNGRGQKVRLGLGE